MGFLSKEELEQYIGIDDVTMVTDEPGSFETAESGAAQIIATITGIDVPASSASAPLWAKQPAAWLTYYGLIGRAQNVAPERLQHWEKKAQMAREMLSLQAGRLTGVDQSGTSSAFGKIENMPEW